MTKKITVDYAAFKELLQALTGPAHLIREIQATIRLPELSLGEGKEYRNPLRVLIDEFNDPNNAVLEDQPASQAAVDQMSEVLSETYQVVGELLQRTGEFQTERGQNLLDNLAQKKRVHTNLLPWHYPSEPMLQWCEPRQPDGKEIFYDHVIAQTPFGRMLVTWKSHKDYPSYTIDEFPGADMPSFPSFSDLESAKGAAESLYIQRLRQGILQVTDQGLLSAVEAAKHAPAPPLMQWPGSSADPLPTLNAPKAAFVTGVTVGAPVDPSQTTLPGFSPMQVSVPNVFPTPDPKYGILNNRLVVMATLMPIPLDEPCFFFRGKDVHLPRVLDFYLTMLRNSQHLYAVNERQRHLLSWQQHNSWQIKEPDTQLHY